MADSPAEDKKARAWPAGALEYRQRNRQPALLAWSGRQNRSAAGGVGVVVAVGLPEMFGVGVDMGLVVVFHGRVVVLVRVGGRHVFSLGAVPQVVHQVSVLVGVNDGVMGVRHGLPPCYLVRAGACSRHLTGHVWRGPRRPGTWLA